MRVKELFRRLRALLDRCHDPANEALVGEILSLLAEMGMRPEPYERN
jgi:hypothetical protein